jgi:hypothetical protein
MPNKKGGNRNKFDFLIPLNIVISKELYTIAYYLCIICFGK